jgi:hypothetical protein
MSPAALPIPAALAKKLYESITCDVFAEFSMVQRTAALTLASHAKFWG